MSEPDYIKVPMPPEDDPEDEQTNEDIYCEALAETLHHVDLPVIVGLYAEWGRNKRSLLDKIEKALEIRSNEQEDGNGGGRNASSLLSFIWCVIFYLAVFRSSFKRVRYIFLSFDAWEYVGCDHIWAGIVTTLLDEIEEKNKILFSVVRAFGGVTSTEGKTWVLKRWVKVFFWVFSSVVIGLVLCIVLAGVFAVKWKYLVYMTLGVPAAVSSFPLPPVLKNIFFTWKNKLQNDIKRKDLKVQLGFMHSVKEEVKTTIDFLRFKALKEDREIRVVLKITSLDRCSPDKVVAALDAINILLCNRNVPFICILAADPSILVEAIQKSSNSCSNGYLCLDRIVSLPFSLPQMSPMTKSQLLKRILEKLLNPATNSDKEYHAKSDKKNKDRLLTKEDIQHIHKYLWEEHPFCDVYLPGNSVQMKRVVNTVLTTLTMIKMGFRPKGGHKMNGKDKREIIEPIIDWIVLANCWPCRLSWILQCVEDEEQRKRFQENSRRTSWDSGESAEVNQWGEISERDHRGLLEIFDTNAGELDKMKNKIEKLLDLDGDPDLFRRFLKEKHFTAEGASHFSDLLLNLDFSLKRRFELLRGLHNIPREKKASDGSPPAEEH